MDGAIGETSSAEGPEPAASENGRKRRIRLPRRVGRPPRDKYRSERSAIRALRELTDEERSHLENRWLQQFGYFEREAEAHYLRYAWARVLVIVLSASLPGIVAARSSIAGFANPDVILAVMGILVTVLVSLEAFFRLGEKARHYRMITEQLRIEGWLFFQLGGDYAKFPDHKLALPTFVHRTEDIYRQDIEGFPWTGVTRPTNPSG